MASKNRSSKKVGPRKKSKKRNGFDLTPAEYWENVRRCAELVKSSENGVKEDKEK